jgi:excisionase family DNA binding protein
MAGGIDMERLLTPREAADYMAVAPRTIKEWLRKGELTGLKVKNMWRIRKSDLEQFIHHGDPTVSHEERGKEPKMKSPPQAV